jgi:hypothetical protein
VEQISRHTRRGSAEFLQLVGAARYALTGLHLTGNFTHLTVELTPDRTSLHLTDQLMPDRRASLDEVENEAYCLSHHGPGRD